MIHTCEKPFHCKYCNKKFIQTVNLNTHERTQTGGKPFECKYCDKKIIKSSHKTQHERIYPGENLLHLNIVKKENKNITYYITKINFY